MVRKDLEIFAKNGDGALWVQVDTIRAHGMPVVQFTIQQATQPGMSHKQALEELARFILTRE